MVAMITATISTEKKRFIIHLLYFLAFTEANIGAGVLKLNQPNG
jgi:hypothetical protein